jgi:glucose/arabinose dehydrogenase
MKITQLSPSRLSSLLGVLIILTEHLGFAAFPELHLKPVVLQQLHSPTCIAAAPDASGRVFVCDQPGKIFIIEGGMMRPIPFLDISSTAANIADRKVLAVSTGYSERGLLSLAFHPGYSNPGSPGYRKFYLNYNKSYQSGIDPPQHDGGSWTVNCTTVIAEFQVSATNPNLADPLSERKVLLYPQPQANHNGGNMVFDANGLLYIGSGDGGASNDNGNGHTGGFANSALGNGQDKTVYLGKILRIDPLGTNGPGGQYGIPAGNPFFGAGGGVKAEIYAFGIRNPWGLAFDDGPGGTGRLFCADVGQGRIEEVNLIVNGGNYGWRYMEGTERPTFSSTMAHPGGTLIDPIVQYGHPGIIGTSLPLLGLSITGGYVYRGSAIPALHGKYVFGDYGATAGAPSGRLMGLEENLPGSGVFTLTQAIPILGGNPLSTRVMCLGRDAAGELYVGTKSSGGVMALENGLPNGGIYKIVSSPVSPAPMVLTAVKDNTVFSELGGGDEELSNGTGPLFMGSSSSGATRRALLQFDLSSVPSGSRFSAALLKVHVNAAETGGGSQRNTFLNRITTSWGEGLSFNASGSALALENDATWTNRFYSSTPPQPWTDPGGDFSAALSSSYGIDSTTGVRGFFGPQMTGDAHAWVTAPSSNFGWLLRSDEGSTATTKTLASREDADTTKRPTLTLVYAGPFEKWLAQYFPSQLTGQWVDPSGDLDGDGIPNQIEYAYGFSPLTYDTQNGLDPSFSHPSGGNATLTTNFLRDSAATDLTYRLEISGDLINWTPIATSLGGAATVGQNGGTVTAESLIGGTILQVNITRSLVGGDAVKQFVRLVVDRTH